MERTATAVWTGALRDGKGSISTQSHILADVPYSFATRFESGKGTNPEALIAAAHAGCFTMAVAAQLAGKHVTPEKLSTVASLTLENLQGAWTISKIHLNLTAKIPGISKQDFDAAAAEAEKNCPVSRVLKADITMTATLESA